MRGATFELLLAAMVTSAKKIKIMNSTNLTKMMYISFKIEQIMRQKMKFEQNIRQKNKILTNHGFVGWR